MGRTSCSWSVGTAEGRVRLDGRRPTADGLHQHAGRLRHGLCLLCQRVEGRRAEPDPGEIVEQVLRLRNLLPPGESMTNIVVMGMGESLANLDNLIAALDRVCSADAGLGMGQRRVTISTVGLPEKIRKLAALDRQYHLAVSLHAPTEKLRNELVPVNEKVGLNAVMEAADDYFQSTGRQVTYEYVLLRDLNDRPEDAQALAGCCRAQGACQPDPVQPGGGPALPAAGARGDPPVRGNLASAGRQRDGPQDQGAVDRRGVRPAPPPARAGLANRPCQRLRAAMMQDVS